ncbi:unnamed protein product [Symbiodinium microadriaticum]|nr:unnamed protein product [Symbiodinium microadriaticum]CAE7948896.1 unnamed protein product [Symbiodinium sp. KB8]
MGLMGMGVLQHRHAIIPASLAGIGVLAVFVRRRYQRCAEAAEAECEELLLSTLGPLAAEAWCLCDVLGLIVKDLGLEAACRCRLLCKAALFSAGLGPKGMQLAAEDAAWTETQREESNIAVSLAALATGNRGMGRSAASEVARAVAFSTFTKSKSLDLWSPDTMGRPPLVAAACCSRQNGWGSSLLTALLEARAQPEASSPDGWNPLMWASQLGNHEDCQVLLKARACPNAVSADGTSPLLCAVRADRQPLVIVKLLLSYRADPALVPMQSPFDEYVDMDVRQALASAPHRR